MKQIIRPFLLVSFVFWLFGLLTASIASAAPTLTTPSPNTVFGGNTQTFTWSADGSPVSNWALYIGSTKGGSDYFKSTVLAGATTSLLANNLPTNAHKAYVRLRYKLNGVWKNLDYTHYLAGLNHAPDISGTPLSTTTVGIAYSFTPTTTEIDGEKLNFSIANKPSWAVFSTTTGQLRGTPKAASTANITITAKDERGATDDLSFSLQVFPPNRIPVIGGEPTTTALVGENYSFTPNATDADGDTLSFSINDRKPTWATFDTTTGQLSGIPTAAGVSEGIVMSVTDGKSASVSLAPFNITVIQSNQAPIISGEPAQAVRVGELYRFAPQASDADKDTLTFSINQTIPWASFDTSTGVLMGTPTSSHIGLISDVVISVTDGKSAPISLPAFNLRVETPLNVARLFGIATQGKDYSSSYPAKAAIDNDLTSYNHTSCDASNNWWQVKLPDPTQVSEIVITSRSSWVSRIKDATVYVTSTPYNGSLNSTDQVGAPLKDTASAQRIILATPKAGGYVIVKASGDNCLHMAEVEVNGQTPATPVFLQTNYQFLLTHGTAQGSLLAEIKAIDYQSDTLTYGIDGAVPFSIDSSGKLSVKGVLEPGATYAFHVTADDGFNTAQVPVTVKITATTAVEDALRTGDASIATTEELLEATIAELANKKTTAPLLNALYGTEAISYTPGNRTQLINFNPWVENVSPILTGNKGNTLAVAGTTATSRYAAFGMSPTELFQAGSSLGFETPFKRLLAWLLAGDVNTVALDSTRKIALSFVSSDKSNIKAWIASKYPNWTMTDCDTVATLIDCYSSADLVLTGWQGNAADAATIRQALATVMAAGKPVLYVHTWYEAYNDVAHAIAELLNFSLPYGGNYWANDAANWTNVAEMQTAFWEKQGLAGIEKMLNHFKVGDYYTLTGLDTEFYAGANKVRSTLTDLDKRKINLFAIEGSRLYRLLALLGDSYRQKVVFPMDQTATEANAFLKSLFADHAVYNYRTLNPAQPDLGNFSRSNFSHITPMTKTVNLTSRQSFRAAGVYALPGQTFRVTRNDSSTTTTQIFVNTLRSGSTHEFETWGYTRPKYLQSAKVPLKLGETITLTSPYGGPIQVEFSANDQPVSLTFEQVGEHPFWDDASDNASFAAKLAAGEYDWAEFVTPAFEIHSTLEKMRESANDSRWGGTLEGFAAATMRYTHNFPHVLAGFKGPGIDVVAEIHDFATLNGYSIENLDLVKHMNADQATCGYGCSGNPYDAYWSFDPIGHGDIHELGHGLEKSRFRFSGWEGHSTTNPYSYYSKTQYYKTTGGEPSCQSLPFENVFGKLQVSIGQADPVSYLQANLWSSSDWSHQVSMTIQMLMAAQNQGALLDGWHLLARLHILEREFNRALASETTWEAKKVSLGFSSYTLTEAKAISNNDWLVVALSYAAGVDYRDYIRMWGQTFTAKADAQVAGFGYVAVARQFFVTSPQGYCKGGGFNGQKLPVDGSSGWVTPLL